MYLEHFDLKERAFGNTPDPRFLFPSRQHQEALARLEYVVEERGMALITGEIGTGKTTLSRALIDSMREHFKPVLLINPRFSPRDFLRMLAQKFDLKPKRMKADLIEQIQDQLFKFYESGVTPVLIIDEAQLIPGKAFFDEIRLLTNFQLDHINLISVLLIGQPELAKRLKHPAYAALNQRITIRFHLTPLQEHDVLEYLQFRWNIAGGTQESFPFPQKSVSKIYAYTGGVPRLINALVTTCLIDALSRDVRKVEAKVVDDQAADMNLPVQPASRIGEVHGRHGRSAQAR